MPVLAARLLHLRVDRGDYFGIALLISLAIHGALLALNFADPPVTPATESTLEVTLLNVRGEAPPDHAAVLAQFDFDGGGDAEKGVASTPLPLTAPDAPEDVVLAALKQRQKELEAEQERLFALLQSSLSTAAMGEAQQIGEGVDEADDELHQDSIIINAQLAAIKEKIARYNARPRQRFVGPSAASSVEAEYVEAWREKIETLGTEHYPPEARGKVYGDLQLTVYIRSDGSLHKVEIDRPSIHPVLNQAAMRIVQLAAPFPPLPAELASETDILAITRSWHFTREQLETQIP